VPDPADCTGVVLAPARPASRPHSNHAAAGEPFGFTVPCSVAVPLFTLVAPCVVTMGAKGGVDVNAIVNVGFQLFVPLE